MGTSLTVQPFASLPGFCSEGTPRVLINMEKVGGLGSRPDDVLLLGDCDTGVRNLAKACGWEQELEELWSKTESKAATEMIGKRDEPAKSKDEKLEDEVAKLSKGVDETLNLSKWHEDKVRKEHLGEKRPDGIEGEIPQDPKDVKDHASRADAKTMRYDEEENEGKTVDTGLGHVYPHMNKKSSL